MARKNPSPPEPVLLQGDLDVFSIHVQWEALKTLLDAREKTSKGPGLLLDLKDLGDVDLSGIQLLLALKRDLETHGSSLSLTGVKEDWAHRFQPLGLSGLLDQEHP